MTPAEFIDNPNWADFLPETRYAKPKALLDHSDCSKLDVESVVGHLRSGGTLGTMSGYEERLGQIQMCGAIAQSFNERSHLMVEAGTGTGKSIAYLVPAIQWAFLNDTAVVVSTATRNLQSQLLSNDIPRSLKTLGENASNFTVALIKGRANYVCLRAVNEFFSAGFWTMSEEDKALMPQFIEFLRTTPDGDLDAYDGISRDLISCSGEDCSSRFCPFYGRCFVYRARRKASEANLVVANHAIVLAETAGQNSLLPAHSMLIMDEAHNLEDIATEQFAKEVSENAMARILNKLVRRGKSRHSHFGGVLGSIERQLAKGAVPDKTSSEEIRRHLNAVTLKTDILQRSVRKMISSVKFLLADRQRSDAVRFRESDVIKPEVIAALSNFEDVVTAFIRDLSTLSEAIGRASEDLSLSYFGEYIQQISNISNSLVAYTNDAVFVLTAKCPESHVYWIEKVKTAKTGSYVRLVASPLSVANELRSFLYEQKDCVVLCSATLRAGGSFKYMIRRLGFHPGVESELYSVDDSEKRVYTTDVAPSPFDFFRQALVLAPDYLADPSTDFDKYVEEFSSMLVSVQEVVLGRTLVLFTSYEMMAAVAERVADKFASLGISLLVQGRDLSREAITNELKSQRRAVVVFGAQSFWEGVDVSGEALSCVVIARLPFPQKDPIVEARAELVEREGGSSFRDYALPQASVRFQQGFGRLIRTKTDMGVVIVADPRLVNKNYGASFRKSIPVTVRPVADNRELICRIRDFTDSASF